MLELLEDRTLLSNVIPLNSQTWMPIGPADITNAGASGRITGVAGDPTDPNTIFISAAGGGVWKTSDAGKTWAPLTDNQQTDFMGSIAIAPSNHNVIYAGTGEANFSIDSFYGRGLLVSSDGGVTWQLKGNAFFDRRAISKIAVAFSDPNTVWVAVTDEAVNSLGGDAGIWKSTDGGNTWSSSLGGEATDVVVDPTNAMIVYAAIGYYRGSSLNGIYKSIDGGSSWAQLSGRLPTGPEVGRIALAISKTNSPQTLYTMISDSGAFDGLGTTPPQFFGTLFKFMKSTDGGLTWADLTFGMPQVLGGSNIYPGKGGAQGWYDIALAIDPSNANIVYAGGTANGGTPGLIESCKSLNSLASRCIRPIRILPTAAARTTAPRSSPEAPAGTRSWVGTAVLSVSTAVIPIRYTIHLIGGLAF